jgi:hypothetical protein
VLLLSLPIVHQALHTAICKDSSLYWAESVPGNALFPSAPLCLQTQHQRGSSAAGWKVEQVGGLFGAGASPALVMEASSAMGAGEPVSMDFGASRTGEWFPTHTAAGCFGPLGQPSLHQRLVMESRCSFGTGSLQKLQMPVLKLLRVWPVAPALPPPRCPCAADGQLLVDHGVLDPLVSRVRCPASRCTHVQPYCQAQARPPFALLPWTRPLICGA